MINWATKENPQPEQQNIASEVERARKVRTDKEAEADAKFERSIRIAMAAKEDSTGCCFFCGLLLDVDGDVKLHPMPYLACKGPPTVNDAPVAITATGRLRTTLAALPARAVAPLPDLKPVTRPFGERD